MCHVPMIRCEPKESDKLRNIFKTVREHAD
jgi:hypothetical protein